MAQVFTVYDDLGKNAAKSFYDRLEAEQFLADQSTFQEESLRIIESELTDNKTTLERYFKANYHQAIEYWVRVDIPGEVFFIIKPMHVSGDTVQFKVVGNGLETIIQ